MDFVKTSRDIFSGKDQVGASMADLCKYNGEEARSNWMNFTCP